MAKRFGLRYVTRDALTIRRERRGKGWRYVNATGRVIRNPSLLRRLARLAVPPAYEAVLYAADTAAHLQAVGRDAAGRLQYRYHPDWEKVREQRKARRLARLAEGLPRIRSSLGQHLAGAEPTRELALAAVIELVSCSAIRAGRETLSAATQDARCGHAPEVERGGRRRSHHPALSRQGRQVRRQGSSSARGWSGRSNACARCPARACFSIARRTARCGRCGRAMSTHSCVRSPAPIFR